MVLNIILPTSPENQDNSPLSLIFQGEFSLYHFGVLPGKPLAKDEQSRVIGKCFEARKTVNGTCRRRQRLLSEKLVSTCYRKVIFKHCLRKTETLTKTLFLETHSANSAQERVDLTNNFCQLTFSKKIESLVAGDLLNPTVNMFDVNLKNQSY